MPFCASCGARFRPEHPQTDVCDECWDHEFEETDVYISTTPEDRVQTRADRIEDAIAAGVDALEAPGHVDRAERQVLVQVDDVSLTLEPTDVVDEEEEAPADLGAPHPTLTVPDLVKPGMEIRTSYNTGGTVHLVDGPWEMHDGGYSIVLRGGGCINGCSVRADGRILTYCGDEITASGEPDLKAIADLERRRAIRASYSAGDPSLADLENLRRLGDSIAWREAKQDGKTYWKADLYLQGDGSLLVNPENGRINRLMLDSDTIGIELTKGWLSHPDHVNVSCTVVRGCGHMGSCMSAGVARKVISAWCKANPVQAPAPLFEQPAAPAPGTMPDIPAFLDRRSRLDHVSLDLFLEPDGQMSLVPGKKTKPVQLDFFA